MASDKLEKLFATRAYDRPRTKTMLRFLEKEAPHRVTGLSIEDDGVFIYTNSQEWSDDAGAGTFREDSETHAVKSFYERVQPSIWKENPRHKKKAKKKRKRNPKKFYVLYDVLSDYSLEPVSGKSQYGSLEHAKKRGVQDNKGRRITWRVDTKWKGGRAWKGANEHEELINIIVERERNPCNYGKKKRKPRKSNPRKYYQIFGYNRAGEIRWVIDNKHPVVTLGLVKTRTRGNRYKTQNAAVKVVEGPGPLRLYEGWKFGVAPNTVPIKQIRGMLGKGKRRGNPVGPTQREVDSAASLFKDFTGDYPERMKNIALRVPKTGLVVGELDGVLYTTVRDGKREAYIHEFKKGSRPLLASSHDGSSLHILGGEYEFTERGIEDR